MKFTFDYVIELLKKRPLMLIGEYNIYNLRYYFAGFFASREDHDFTPEELNFSLYFDK